jgi:hypothetical protein
VQARIAHSVSAGREVLGRGRRGTPEACRS